MSAILIVGEKTDELKKLKSILLEAQHKTNFLIPAETKEETVYKLKPDITLFDFNKANFNLYLRLKKILKEIESPLIVLCLRENLSEFNLAQGDDFLLKPLIKEEVLSRLKLALWRMNKADNENIIKKGDLVIDCSKYEVKIDDNKVDLTYKEYELLKFLATNPGRVYSRDALLNKIWGYDYYGGTRTVDVHIRRLRGKIEDNKHAFIDTVRNVGYKFIE